jgi:6-phosphogluconolactonase (cycloisomerase 2 family)
MSKDYNEYFCGMVYIMTNSAEGNQIAAFYRGPDGKLSLQDLYNTHGRGTGTREVSLATPNDGIDPLASQGSLILSNNHHFLFAVNAGSNSISSFRVFGNGELSLVDVVPSGGLQPNSLCAKNNLLYVTNVGDKNNDFNSNITGFNIDTKGKLTHIPYSTYSLSTPNAQPSHIIISPDDMQLIVSEITTNRLSVYPINNKLVTCPTVNNSNGVGPFGSVFTYSGIFIVAEAGTNALSSYMISPNGLLEVISESVENGQQATCWVSITPDGKYAYTSNTGSRTISFYRVYPNGSLDYIESIYSTPDSSNMGAPIDNGISNDGQYFYALNGNKGSISVFSINSKGHLDLLQEVECREIPRFGSQGLAVF